MSRKFDRPRSWIEGGNDNRTFLSFNLIRQLLIESIRRGNRPKIHAFQAIENVLSIGKKYPINTHANEPFNYECWCKPPNGSLPSSYDNINWTALDQKTCQVSWTSASNYSLAEITNLLRHLDLKADSIQRYITDENVVNFLSELQRHAGGRWLQPTALHTRCVPHVNYTIHGHILAIRRAQRFQERSLLSIKGSITSIVVSRVEISVKIGKS